MKAATLTLSMVPTKPLSDFKNTSVSTILYKEKHHGKTGGNAQTMQTRGYKANKHTGEN